jgi:hypothetical protein
MHYSKLAKIYYCKKVGATLAPIDCMWCFEPLAAAAHQESTFSMEDNYLCNRHWYYVIT